ncbi:MAG TPA: hypothetical protein VE078_04915 [Thermoanaerobaculia bacterium]|nr:hypothetical protein [Thermoanaerobaculia bacterium]
MFQKRTRRAALALVVAVLLLAGPLQAAGWTARGDLGLLEMAWSWVVEWVTGSALVTTPVHSGFEATEVPRPPDGQEPIRPAGGDDGGAIDPNG